MWKQVKSHTPCCAPNNWEHCQEMCAVQMSVESSEAVLNMQFPSVPLFYCYTGFILKSYVLPCLKLDCFSREVCFHPYYYSSRYICHAAGTTQMSKTCHKGLFQNILFWKWDKVSFCNTGACDSRCHFVTLVLAITYGWWLFSVTLVNIILSFHIKKQQSRSISENPQNLKLTFRIFKVISGSN